MVVAGLAATAWLLGWGMTLAGRGAPGPAGPILAAKPTAPVGPVADVPLRRDTVELRGQESLATALVRGGLSVEEAGRAAIALRDEFDTVNPHPGLRVLMQLADGNTPGLAPRLMRLTFSAGDDASLSLWRDRSGVMRARRDENPVFTAPSVVEGVVDGSLYLSVVDAGVTPDMAAMIVALFGRKLDLSRDVESGDRFRLIFERPQRADGSAIAAPTLLYAGLSARAGLTRFYRIEQQGSAPAEYLDAQSGQVRTFLLRTPLDGARITSGFGPRLHPILGFTRMHEGVDFGAPTGTPVLAAGDGVVEEARWAGGYGRWLKLRHGQGFETGYGHLSAWAPGIAPGVHVRQGQVVAYVGATGLATGPHLHYEVIDEGHKIDPKLANGALLAAAPRPSAFRAQKASIDAILADETNSSPAQS